MDRHSKRALVLSGGGARAAYQVGALKALAQLLPAGQANPFPIICGTSAGAVNAAVLAAHPGSFHDAVADLERLWRGLVPADIYKHGWLEVSRSGLRIVGSLLNRGVAPGRPLSLLDNSPLRRLIENNIRFQQIDTNLRRGSLDAICVTAMSYSSGESVCFFQASPEMQAWRRPRRVGRKTLLNSDHILASSAIPTLFPATKLEHDYFGDGALRQLSPLSPAIHLGARQLFIIGVSDNRARKARARRQRPEPRQSPSIAQIVGHLLNSAFVDSLEEDIERLERTNRLLEVLPPESLNPQDNTLRPIDNVVVSPSEPLDEISASHIGDLPPSVRALLGSTGATTGGGATSASYLLFTPQFIGDLIALGQRDTLWSADHVRRLFSIDA
ncbi:MAG: patatin-like phospholipase family protein [Halioglobus sp.]